MWVWNGRERHKKPTIYCKTEVSPMRPTVTLTDSQTWAYNATECMNESPYSLCENGHLHSAPIKTLGVWPLNKHESSMNWIVTYRLCWSVSTIMDGIPRSAFKNMHTQACGKYAIISPSKVRVCFRETRPCPEASNNTVSTHHPCQIRFSRCAHGMIVLQDPCIGQVYYEKKIEGAGSPVD
jgi:hypothetical protein